MEKDKRLICQEAYLILGRFIEMRNFIEAYMGMSVPDFCNKLVAMKGSGREMTPEEMAKFADSLKELAKQLTRFSQDIEDTPL